MSEIKLTEEFRSERGRKLVNLIVRDLKDRSRKMNNVRSTRAMYFDQGIGASGPWEGSSDVHLPVLVEKIEGVIPKVSNAFWGADPLTHVQYPADRGRRDEAKDEERYLNWALRSDIKGFYSTTEGWIRNMLLDGTSVVKAYWSRKWRQTVDITPVKLMYDTGEMTSFGEPVQAPREKSGMEILAEIFGFGQLAHTLIDYSLIDGSENKLVGQKYDVEFIDDRRKLEGTADIRESEFVDEVDVYVYRDILVEDAPRIEVVEFEDFIVPFRTKDIQSADRIVQQYWITREEAVRRVDDGIWDLSEEDKQVLLARRTSKQEEMEDNKTLKRQKDAVVGEHGAEQREDEISLPKGHRVYDENKILIFEIYLQDDVHGDGELTEVIYDVPFCLKKVANARYLDEEFPHKQRPFISAQYQAITDRFYGRSMGDLIFAIAVEIDTIINHVNNSQELINNPFFFYVPTAMSVDPEILTGIQPGTGIPVQDISGVMFPKFAQEPLANLSAMDTLLLFADRITISPMNVGSPQVRNAPRTARGTMSMLAEGNIKLDMIVRRMQEDAWGKLMFQISMLYGRFGGEEKWYRITGNDEPQRFNPARLRGKLDFTFKGNTVNTNKAAMQAEAQVRFNTLLTHPDYMQDPYARQALIRDFLNHFGDGAEVEELIPQLPGMAANSHPPMPQKSENQILSLGQFVDVLPSDDDAAHLQEMDRFEKSSRFETMDQHAVAVYAAHRRSHMANMQQKMAQGQQGASPGQGNNVPTGETLAGGTGMNALEGGVQ